MSIAIFAVTVVAALACLVGGLWLAWASMRHFHRAVVRSSQSGQLPMVEMTLMVAAPLFVLVVLKLAITLVVACGLWAMSATGS